MLLLYPFLSSAERRNFLEGGLSPSAVMPRRSLSGLATTELNWNPHCCRHSDWSCWQSGPVRSLNCKRLMVWDSSKVEMRKTEGRKEGILRRAAVGRRSQPAKFKTSAICGHLKRRSLSFLYNNAHFTLPS